MSKQIGYVRVSTTHQATDRQVAALKDAGCEVALTPMECLQRIYIMYDEEVNAK